LIPRIPLLSGKHVENPMKKGMGLHLEHDSGRGFVNQREQISFCGFPKDDPDISELLLGSVGQSAGVF